MKRWSTHDIDCLILFKMHTRNSISRRSIVNWLITDSSWVFSEFYMNSPARLTLILSMCTIHSRLVTCFVSWASDHLTVYISNFRIILEWNWMISLVSRWIVLLQKNIRWTSFTFILVILPSILSVNWFIDFRNQKSYHTESFSILWSLRSLPDCECENGVIFPPDCENWLSFSSEGVWDCRCCLE